MEPCAFDKLFTINVPHILERIFFSLDYESFKACLKVNKTWHKLLSSEAFQRWGKSAFQEKISIDEKKLWHAARENKVREVMSLLSSGLLNINSDDWFARTPLQVALTNGHKNVVKFDNGVSLK